MDPTRCLAAPDLILVDPGDGWRAHAGSGVAVELVRGDGLAVLVGAARIARLRLRWRLAVGAVRLLGDAWERGYGDLEWRGVVAERAMPWYVLIHDGAALHGLGVATGGAAMAAWFVDAGGVTLELDLRCGGLAVEPGARLIAAATVIARCGTPGEDEHAAAHAFCRRMCPAPRLPAQPVLGLNDWYYAYGSQDGAGVRRDAERLARWCDGLAVRPWCVIDGGWEAGVDPGGLGGGDFSGRPAFGDMGELASAVAACGVRPGLWLRPLQAPLGWSGPLLAAPREGRVLDPSTPEALADVQRRVRVATAWGYQLLKHDFSTFDVCGRWGFQMGGGVAADGWAFADRGRTTAEILRGLYAAIRAAAGDALVLGCNTVGHLAAGLEELQRTGDDTSGRAWERTRKMGPNTLAMRMPQHGAFFAADADCIGLTTAIPWQLNRAWLEAVAGSGTALFVSPHPDAVGAEQDTALRAAFATAAASPAPAAALDWRDTTAPCRWRTAAGERSFAWDDDGALVPCPP
jgi:alpha-galactosidase